MASKLIRFISPEDFEKLYKAEKDKRVKLALMLGFGSGLRISEIVGWKRKDGTEVQPLVRENVDLQTHQIKVISGKGNKDRITVTPPNMTEAHLKLLPLKMPRRTLQYRFQKLTKGVLGQTLPFHATRHGFANNHVNVLGTPLPMVQAALGHSRLDTTGIYTKANPVHVINNMWERMKDNE